MDPSQEESHDILTTALDLEEFGWGIEQDEKEEDDRWFKMSPVGSPNVSDISPTSPTSPSLGDELHLHDNMEHQQTDMAWISEVLAEAKEESGTVCGLDHLLTANIEEFIQNDNLLFVQPDMISADDTNNSAVTVSEFSDLGPEGIVPDQELISLSVRDLNKRLQRLPEEMKKSLKRRRRTLKNRGYARNCRSKRMQRNVEVELTNMTLQEQVESLRNQVEDGKSENERICRERDHYRDRYHQLVSMLTESTQQANVGEN